MDDHDDGAAACVVALLQDAYQRRSLDHSEDPSGQFTLGHEQDLFVIDDIIYDYDVRATKMCQRRTFSSDMTRASTNQSSTSNALPVNLGTLFVRCPHTPVLKIDHAHDYLDIHCQQRDDSSKQLKKPRISSSNMRDAFHFYRNEPSGDWNDADVDHYIERSSNYHQASGNMNQHKPAGKPSAHWHANRHQNCSTGYLKPDVDFESDSDNFDYGTDFMAICD